MEIRHGKSRYRRGTMDAIETRRFITITGTATPVGQRPDDTVEHPVNVWNDPPLELPNALIITTEKIGQRYAPVGRCIYCSVTGVPLSLEHIVPEGLGAALKLPEASCEECQKITTRIEGSVLRSIFAASRQRLHIRVKTRKRDDKFPVTEIINGERVSYDLPLREHPSVLALPMYNRPTMICKPHEVPTAAPIAMALAAQMADIRQRLSQ